MFQYERESRTAQSECYVIENERGSEARIDLHFGEAVTYGTLCVPVQWSDQDIQDVIADIDDRLVRTADPFRDDFIVTVWSGAEVGVYSNEETLEDLLEGADDAAPTGSRE